MVKRKNRRIVEAGQRIGQSLELKRMEMPREEKFAAR